VISPHEFPYLLALWYCLMFVLLTVLGLAVALVGWGGGRAGLAVGALVLLAGAANLAYTLLTPFPRMWWASVVPIFAGWLAISAWRARGTATARLPFRFGLRGLMLLTLASAAVIGGVVAYSRAERFEAELLAPLRGVVDVYRTAFGRAKFVILHAGSEQNFDRAIAALKQLDDLHDLQINESNVPPGRAMRELAQLTSLRWLSLQHLPVTDPDLAPLGNLRGLEELELDGSRLTDAGLVHLYPLKRLRKLYLYNADPQKVTPTGLARLHAALPNLPPGYP
jgi:hypothetical protein